MAMDKDYARNVFLNCPFDEDYRPVFRAIVFAVYDCGFIPRCALEEEDSGDFRFEKIKRLIFASKFGVHDISRTELDDDDLPRFNMPLELGVFIGVNKSGQKKTLILDRERYRYQQFISDIAGQDIRSHGNQPSQAIRHVRDWLNAASGRKTIPGGANINTRYQKFQQELPLICREFRLKPEEITYNDYGNFVSAWLGN